VPQAAVHNHRHSKEIRFIMSAHFQRGNQVPFFGNIDTFGSPLEFDRTATACLKHIVVQQQIALGDDIQPFFFEGSQRQIDVIDIQRDRPPA
jgi:hypothetical protein